MKIRHLLLVLFLLVLFLGPLLLLGVQSVSQIWRFPDLLPESLSLRHWFKLGESAPLIRGLLSSAFYSLLVVLLSLALTYGPARLLAWNAPRRKSFWEALLIAPAVMPVITTALGLHLSFTHLRITDTLPAVVLPLTFYAYPYLLRSLIAGFELLGPLPSLAAKNLGAGPLRVFWEIEIPQMLTPLISGATIVFLVAFSDYLIVFLFGGGAVASFTGQLMPALAASDRSRASALTLVFLALPLAAFGILELLVLLWSRKRGTHP